jgi:hypothetical protein
MPLCRGRRETLGIVLSDSASLETPSRTGDATPAPTSLPSKEEGRPHRDVGLQTAHVVESMIVALTCGRPARIPEMREPLGVGDRPGEPSSTERTVT